jgi:hypothetical protein
MVTPGFLVDIGLEEIGVTAIMVAVVAFWRWHAPLARWFDRRCGRWGEKAAGNGALRLGRRRGRGRAGQDTGVGKERPEGRI